MKIFCIGRNYAKHAKEMGAETPTQPMFFMKPDTSILRPGTPFFYPDFSNDIHYECEVVVKINRVGKNIEEKFAHKYYDEIGLGIDFTARDLQQKCKENGHPWEIAKSFESSAAIGRDFINKADLDLSDIKFQLKKNGEIVQSGSSVDMIFSIDKLIAYLSQFMTLKKGDLIYTGTPEGVGSIKIGDVLEGTLEGTEIFTVKVK